MKIKYAVIDLAEPLDVLPGFSHHCSFEEAGILGFYDHFAGFGYVTEDAVNGVNEPDLSSFEEMMTFIDKGVHDAEDVLSYLTRRTAALHEGRHFFDCFCTPNGFDVFAEFSWAFAMFASIIKELTVWTRENGKTLLFPVEINFQLYDLPKNLVSWWNHTKDHLFDIAVDIGHFPLTTLEGHDFENDFTVARGQTCSGKKLLLPCVHINVFTDSGQQERVLWPVGFSLILECLAIITQGSMIGNYGHDMVMEFRKSFQRHGPNPYTALIGALNRIFKSRGYLMPDDQDHYKVAFRSLFFRYNDFINKSSRNKAPLGWSLMYVLEEYVEIINGKLEWVGPDLDRSDHLRNREDIQGLPNSLIYYIQERYFNKVMSANTPLEFDSQFGWMFLEKCDLTPPVIFVSDGDVIVKDQEFLQLWMNWFFIRDLVSSALSTDIFICPVLKPHTSWLFNKIKPGPECHATEKTCGIWRPNTTYDGPKCMWSVHLKEIINSG